MSPFAFACAWGMLQLATSLGAGHPDFLVVLGREAVYFDGPPPEEWGGAEGAPADAASLAPAAHLVPLRLVAAPLPSGRPPRTGLTRR